MSHDRFDLVVIGGGPGGYPAAIRASQLGLRAALVEREHLGGVCLNWGCIPTKALLRAAEIRHWLAEAGEFGLEVGEVRIDLPRVVARSRRVAERLRAGVEHLLAKSGVEVITGSARLDGPAAVEVRTANGVRGLAAPHVVLATGARARPLSEIAPHGDSVWTHREAMLCETLPRSLVVVGSGAIGIEFASFYRDLGVDVTVLEALPRILPAEDAEISGFARRAFERQGIAIHTQVSVTSVEHTAAGARVHAKRSDGALAIFEAERVLVAVGITGNVEDLGLEATRARVERGHIAADAWGRTGEPGLYAIGDVAGPPYLAHKAMHEGVLCVERLAGRADARPLDPTRIPACTYSRPQIASVGWSEEAAREAGVAVRVGRAPLRANGKAFALGDTTGLVKTVFAAETGELLGAHLVGPEVTELVQGFALARGLEASEAELLDTVFPHPTVSEAMRESVLAAFGRAIHT